MTKSQSVEPVTPGTDDQLRMRRLSEEIFGRFAEASMIMERVLGADGLRQRATSSGARLSLNLKEGQAGRTEEDASRSGATPRYYICVEVDGATWEDPPGWCREGGCF